jgi:hypothetical protein
VAEDISRIRAFLRGLVWRERALLLARVSGRAALVWAASVAWFALVPYTGVERAAAVLLLVLGVGMGGWAAVAWPLLREWGAAGDALRQADRVERVRPGLRGRLLTAVDGAGLSPGRPAPVAPDRQPLLQLVVSRAVRGIADVRAGEVHRLRRAAPALLGGAFAALVGLVAFAAAGPRHTVAWWFRGSEALAAAAVTATLPEVDRARVGDLVLRYTFPDYTGLEPKVVENGTGDVEAPPGTVVDVVARSADPAEAAGLVAYDENLEAGLGPDGRELSGRFTVRPDAGTWRFEVFRGGVAEPSRDFAVEPVADLPPAVTVSVGDGVERLEVSVDQRFGLEWSARDDYGVRSVFLAVDGKDREPALERPERRRAEVAGRAVSSPRELGLQPGDRVRVAVVAWDNDTVSGSKRGESRAVELVVLGAQGRDDQLAQRRVDLVEAMIPVLADHLVDPWPPGDDAGSVAAYGERVAERYRPLAALAEAAWAGMTRKGADRTAVEHVVETGRDLVRYTQVAVEPGSVGPVPVETFQMAAKLRGEAIVALEDAVLMLNRMMELRALGEVVRTAEDLSSAAARLEQALASPEPDVQELLAQLDQLERMMSQLQKQAAKMGQSGLQEYVQSRQSEISALMDEIRKAIAEGRLDDARKLMERLAKAMREMSDGVRQQLENAERQSSDADDAAGELQKKLEQLEAEQRALQSEVDQLQREDRSSERADELWAQLERKVAEHERSAREFAGGLQHAGRSFLEQERSASGVEAADDLERAVAAKDVRGAREKVVEGDRSWKIERRVVEMELKRRAGQLPGPGTGELQVLLGQLEAIDALLDQLEQSQSADPATQERAKQLEEQQRQLEQRTREAMEEAQQLERQMPVRPQGMSEAMEDAQRRMQQAGDDLEQGQPMQAGGSQQMAADRLREARDSLQEARDQAAQQMREMQQGRGEQGSGEPEEGREGEDGEEEGHDFSRPDSLEIPGREAFQTPEEYRRALLEGMEGEVPEEYRAMKKRYFEELVSQ